jgi:hypothetical protein
MRVVRRSRPGIAQTGRRPAYGLPAAAPWRWRIASMILPAMYFVIAGSDEIRLTDPDQDTMAGSR